MDPLRKVLAQGALLAVVGSMFLTWSGDGVSAGTATGEGQVAALAAVLTMGLIQAGWRPAWIGAGFIVATLLRAGLELGSSTGLAIIAGTCFAAFAALVMIWDMFAAIERPDADPAPDAG